MGATTVSKANKKKGQKSSRLCVSVSQLDEDEFLAVAIALPNNAAQILSDQSKPPKPVEMSRGGGVESELTRDDELEDDENVDKVSTKKKAVKVKKVKDKKSKKQKKKKKKGFFLKKKKKKKKKKK